MQNPEIVIIGAAIIDVLAYPVNVKVFETGSYSTEDNSTKETLEWIKYVTSLQAKQSFVQ